MRNFAPLLHTVLFTKFCTTPARHLFYVASATWHWPGMLDLKRKGKKNGRERSGFFLVSLRSI
jgi:hypothetical protein